MNRSLFCHLLFLSFVLCCIIGCQHVGTRSETELKEDPIPKHFVFVPGSFHAAWCWDKMKPLLSKDGNTCEAIDLPGHATDTMRPSEITLNDYVDAVCKVLEKHDGKVTLIGHSRGGIVISQVAERAPHKIERLVYLCAFLIPDGEPMVATSLMDSSSLLATNLIFNEAEGWHFPKHEAIREAFYNDCSEEDVNSSVPKLTKEPIAPVATPLSLSAEGFGSVQKAYIKTTLDRTITPELQQMMVERIQLDTVVEMEAGHSPFLSKPQELADILLGLSRGN